MFKLISLFIVLSSNSWSLETDQFLAADKVIKDSSIVLTKYFLKNIDKAIDHANKKNQDKIECREIADNVLTNLVGKYSISKISQFAKKSPEIDIFPDRTISDGDYSDMSFYEKGPIFIKIVPFARTINLNGIHMGTDKLGHFSLVGRNYYHNYLSYIESGLSNEAALKKAILKGFKTEKGLLGYGVGGVLSFGDLEANYQGLRFAIDMCEGENPYLVKNNNRWELNQLNKFDLKKYFNPKMDESFNFSFWRPYLFKMIKKKMNNEYCSILKNPQYVERMAFYKSILVENYNDKLVKEYLLTIPKYDRKLEDVESFCHDK